MDYGQNLGIVFVGAVMWPVGSEKWNVEVGTLKIWVALEFCVTWTALTKIIPEFDCVLTSL